MSLVKEPATPAGREPPLRKNRDFLLLWTGVGASLLGTRVSAIAYPLLVLWGTGSASAAGLVAFAAQLPSLVVQLPAGVLVDRWDRRRLMIICNAGGAIALASVAVAAFLDHVWLPHLMAAAFIESALTIFYRLAERAAVRNIVPASQLSTALSQNEVRSRVAGLLGQPAGSLIFAVTRWAPMAFTAFTHVFSLVGLLLIRKDFQQRRSVRPRGLVGPVKEGVAWVWGQGFLRTVMGIIAGSNIVSQGLALTLLVIVHDAGGSTTTIAVIVGARGVGGVLGAVTGPFWTGRMSMRAVVTGGTLIWAALVPLVAVVRDPLLLGAVFAGISFVGGAFNVVGGIYQVRITPDGMQGRVNSVMDLLGSGATSLGALACGFLLEARGATTTVVVLSVGMAAVAATALASPSVRRLGRERVDDIPPVMQREDDAP